MTRGRTPLRPILAWATHDDETGWCCDVWLFDDVRGEIRAYQHDTLKWTHDIGLDEIAIFASGRKDLAGQYLDQLMIQYRPQ